MSSKQTKRATFTAKQRLFVHEYCIDTNATQAAKRAGYSPKTAHAIGRENLQKPTIRAEINKLLGNACNHLDITVERILDEESCIAFLDIRELVDANNNPLQLEQLPTHITRALSGMEIKDKYDWKGALIGRKYKYQFYNKGQALQRLEKVKGMIADRIQIDLTATLELVSKIIAEECQPDQIERIGGRFSELERLKDCI